MGGWPVTTGGGMACHCVMASASMEFTSRRTLANSELISDGRIPGGYGLETGAEVTAAFWAHPFLPATVMESATLKSTTTDITVNRRRVINFPFHGLLFAGYCSQTEKTKDSHSSLALPKVYGQWVADEKLRLLFGLVEYPPLCG